MKISSRLGILLCFGVIAACSSIEKKTIVTGPAQVLSTWTALGPNQTQILRVVMSNTPCPSVETEKGSVQLTPRSQPNKNFPIQVCEASFPLPTQKVVMNGKSLPVLKTADPKRILILGDTGCRLKAAGNGYPAAIQACNDTEAWPFAKVSAAAAAWKPDLVIHTGDYHYREAACPEGNKGCEGASIGDVWGSWNEDFNIPAKPLLEAAPWIVARGNHENCVRAGEGWFLLYEPGPMQTCTDTLAPYDVQLQDQTIHVIDATDGNHMTPSFEKLKPRAKGFNWVLSHRPFVTPGSLEEKYRLKLPAALEKRGAISVVMAGHWHFVNLLTQPGKGKAAEFIVGNGGTALDTDHEPFIKQPGVKTVSTKGFGFTTMEKQKTGSWKVVLHDMQGKPVKRCSLKERVNSEPRLQCY